MIGVRIEIPVEGVTVTATCGHCHEPVGTTSGSVSWLCHTETCWVWQIPMWEDARFVDDDGIEWILTDDGDWIDVVEDEYDHAPDCPDCETDPLS